MKLARGLQTRHVAIAGSQGPGCAHLKSTEMRKRGDGWVVSRSRPFIRETLDHYDYYEELDRHL